ncbi:DUF2730 family protein [Rhizobium mayense]|uniref:DUF2730 family protein n=1 Tax=Rhizobium mayense TaxID=1312184 RepID=A0ABT7JZS5_9HYPH|nr:DUF2730 family protein [Rhizobium mayense]MDL2401268.1 DUF2730 family protein [Rhizobium mayense]
MTIDPQSLLLWLTIISSLISIGTAVWVGLSSGPKKIASRLDDHANRLATVENDLKHMPSQDTVHRLQLDLTEMKGQIGVMAKSSEVTERTTRRVEEFLLSRKD